eukprot:6212927-Pleurochrysis_carterae.AAC.5
MRAWQLAGLSPTPTALPAAARGGCRSVVDCWEAGRAACYATAARSPLYNGRVGSWGVKWTHTGQWHCTAIVSKRADSSPSVNRIEPQRTGVTKEFTAF